MFLERINNITNNIQLYLCDIYFIGITLGILTTPIFNILGVYSEDKAIEYYGEVHTSMLNSFIHTIFMPFTYYGLLIGVPGLIFKNKRNIFLLQRFFYTYFISYYLTLNTLIGGIIAIYYLPGQIKAENYYKNYSFNRIVTVTYGILVAVTALTIQEVFGHWLGGDNPSRLEAVPNAIWHAGYYSIYHIFN
jgi:hypothetical protein